MDTKVKRGIIFGVLLFGIIILIVFSLYGIRADDRQGDTSRSDVQLDTFDQKTNNKDPDEAYLKSNNTEGFGLAKRIYSNGKFMHTISATLPKISEPEFYQGWLINSSGDSEYKEFISTGKLADLDGEFFLFYESDQDLRTFTQVVVSKQAVEKSSPDDYILLGSFAN